MASIEIENENMELVSQNNSELLKEVIEKVKQMSLGDLQKLQVAMVAAMSKPIREATKLLEKAEKKPKKSSPHLAFHRAWTAFVLAHALANGWSAFEATTVKKDKSVETTSYAASVQVNGKFVFADTKKAMTSPLAASLAKTYWSQKENSGSNKELFDEFMADWTSKNGELEATSSSTSKTASPKVTKTAAEKEAEKEEKKQQAQAKKDAEKLKKAAEKEAERLRKEAEKIAAMELALQQKKEALASGTPSPKAKAPKKKAVPDAAVAATAAVSTDASPKRVVKKKAAFVDDFKPSSEDPDVFDTWMFNGKEYGRNCLNEIADENDEIIGKYNPKTNQIDSE